jgi:hypothetical protein
VPEPDDAGAEDDDGDAPGVDGAAGEALACRKIADMMVPKMLMKHSLGRFMD